MKLTGALRISAMRRSTSFIVSAASLLAIGLISPLLHGADILVNGGLEDGAGPQAWTLLQATGPAPPLGDFNNNGTVDAADYVVWRKNLNGPYALPNDNGLGTPVSSAHYDLWRSSFGNTGAGLPVAA